MNVKDCTFIAGANTTQQVYLENLNDITLSGNKFEGSVPEIEKGDGIVNYKQN